MANGALFLVSGVGDVVQVKQLDRDISKLKFQPPDLMASGKADAEITAFFSEPAMRIGF